MTITEGNSAQPDLIHKEISIMYVSDGDQRDFDELRRSLPPETRDICITETLMSCWLLTPPDQRNRTAFRNDIIATLEVFLEDENLPH